MNELYQQLYLIAAFVVFVVLVLRPLVHVVIHTARRIAGRPLDLDPWITTAFILLIPCAIAFLLTRQAIFDAVVRPSLTGDAMIVFAVSVVTVFVLAMLGPVVLPLVRAYARGQSAWLRTLLTLAAILVMPMVAFLTSAMIAQAYAAVETYRTQRPVSADMLALFEMKPDLADCEAALIDGLGITTPRGLSPDLPDATKIELGFAFWTETTAKSLLLDSFEVYGCGFSPITHKVNDPVAATLVFAYRTFLSAVFLTVVAMPLGRLLERRRQQQQQQQ